MNRTLVSFRKVLLASTAAEGAPSRSLWKEGKKRLLFRRCSDSSLCFSFYSFNTCLSQAFDNYVFAEASRPLSLSIPFLPFFCLSFCSLLSLVMPVHFLLEGVFFFPQRQKVRGWLSWRSVRLLVLGF